MKNTLARFCIVFLCLLLVSCATTEVDKMQIMNEHSVPTWFENPAKLVNSSQTPFTGKGASVSKRQAELLAYTDLISNVEKYTGTALENEDYRELTTAGTLDSYGLKIKKVFVSYNGANYIVYVGAIAKTSAVEAYRSPEVIEHYVQLDRIEELILSGDDCIRKGNYVGAVKKYMQSMLISHEMSDVKDEYSYPEILKEVTSILSSMFFTSKQVKVNSNDMMISLKIKESIIPAEVSNSDVEASFNVSDVKGNRYSEKFTYTTDEFGRFIFSPTVFTAVNEESVVFSFGIQAELEALAEIAPEDALNIQSIIDEKSLNYEYRREYSSGALAVAELQYMMNRSFYENPTAAAFTVEKFSEAEAECFAVSIESDLEDQEIIESVLSFSPECGCVLVIRVELVKTIESSSGTLAASANGSAVMYNTKDGSVMIDTGIINTTGFGKTVEEARDKAFRSIEEIAFNFVRTAYV